MKIWIKRFAPALISMSLLSPACLLASQSDQTDAWPTYKLDFNAYIQNQLPPPAVMYIFNQAGQLTCMVNTHGQYDAATLDTISSDIINGKCQSLTSSESSLTSRNVRNFLLDQGYKLKDLVDKNTPYTALLTIWNPRQVSTSGCKRLIHDQGAYIKKVRDTVSTHSEATHHISIRMLSIGAENVHFC